jgi:uncharacterized YigZ family protein
VKIQRSRFIAHAFPADGESAALELMVDLRRRYHDARHVCSAWRLGPEPPYREKRNDDGEPGGTAGEPILAAIARSELTDVVVGVVRYFGGIKLGTGGLARAYGQAAEEALAAARTKVIRRGLEFRLSFPYAQQKNLGHLLDRCGGRIRAESYEQDVTWTIWLPHSTWVRFEAELREATAGSVVLKPI